jgi:tetratricopeptide (TPR) repeat protein
MGYCSANLDNVLMALGRRETGTAKLLEAVDAYRSALTQQDPDYSPSDWALTQHNLGAVMEMIADREEDAQSARLAIEALRAALKIRTPGSPDWASTQASLGAALATLDRLEEGAHCFEESVAAYEAAVSASVGHLFVQRLATTGLHQARASTD